MEPCSRYAHSEALEVCFLQRPREAPELIAGQQELLQRWQAAQQGKAALLQPILGSCQHLQLLEAVVGPDLQLLEVVACNTAGSHGDGVSGPCHSGCHGHCLQQQQQ